MKTPDEIRRDLAASRELLHAAGADLSINKASEAKALVQQAKHILKEVIADLDGLTLDRVT